MDHSEFPQNGVGAEDKSGILSFCPRQGQREHESTQLRLDHRRIEAISSL